MAELMADQNHDVTPIEKTRSMNTADSMAREVGPLYSSAHVNVGVTERLISVASGLLLFGWGIYRRGLLGYGAMAIAAALCDRGIRGHSGMYPALGKTTAAESRDGDNSQWTQSLPELP